MADKDLTLGVLFTSQAKQLLSELQKVKREINSINNVNQRAVEPATRFGRAMQSLGSSFKTVIRFGVAASVIGGFISSLRSGVNEIIEFSQGLKNFQAITGATTSEVAIISDKLIELAAKTRYSSLELSEAAVIMGQAGFTASETFSAIAATATLATGTMSNMTTAVDLMTTTLRAFDLDALEASRVADVMANAVNKSKLDIDKLRIAFNYVGASAAQAGLSVEETAATMAVLSNNGLRASTIGTGFRQVLARLIAPNQKLKELYVAHGIALEEINPLTVGYQKALFNLTRALSDSKTGQVDMAKAFQLFGLRGAQAVAIIVKSFRSGALTSALKQMFEVGAAEKMAAIQSEGLGIKLKNLKDRFGVLALAIGNAGVGGALGFLIDMLRGTLSIITMLANTMAGGIAVQFALWSAGIYGVIAAVNMLIPLLKTLATYLIWTRANAGMIILSNPWLLAAAAIAGVVIAIKEYNDYAKNAAMASAKLAEEQRTVTDSLSAYVDKLIVLKAAQAENKDISEEYRATLERLIKDHPELAGKIKLTTGALDDNLRALKKVVDEKNAVRMKQLADSIGKYNIAVVKAEKDTSRWGNMFETILKASPGVKAAIDLWTQLINLRTKYFTWKEGPPKKVNFKTKDIKGDEAKRLLEETKPLLDTFAEGNLSRLTFQSGGGLVDIAKWLQQVTSFTDEQIAYVLQKMQQLKIEAMQVEAELAKLSQTTLKETDAFYKTLFNKSTLEQQIRLSEIQTEGENKLAAIKSFAEKNKDLNINLANIEAEVRKEINMKALEEIQKNEATAIHKRIEDIKNELSNVNKEFKLQLANPETRQATLDEYKAKILDIQLAVSKLANEFTKIKGVSPDQIANLESIKKLYEEIGQATKAVSSKDLESQIFEFETLQKDKIDKIKQGISDLNKELSLMDKKFKFAAPEEKQTALDAYKLKLEELKQAVSDLVAEFAKLKGIEPEQVENLPSVKKLKESLGKTGTTIEGKDLKLENEGNKIAKAIKNANDELDNLPLDVIDQIGSSLANAAINSDNLAEAFKRMTMSIIADITKIILKLLILKAIQTYVPGANSLFSLSSSLGLKQSGGTETGLSERNRFARTTSFSGTDFGASLSNQREGTTIIIQATDAQSFAKMLATKQSQEMVTQTIKNKFVHNAGFRTNLRRGF